MAPRRLIDPEYKIEVREQYQKAATQKEKNAIIKRACKITGYTYGGLIRAIEANVRTRALTQGQMQQIEYYNSLGKLVWDYQSEHSTKRWVSTTMAIKRLKETGILPVETTYNQISVAIRRQRFKNKSGSYFTPFERSEPLEMIQLDFTRSRHFQHIRKNGKSYLQLSEEKGANAKQNRVWIAVAVDDSTRMTYARYYLASGESSLLARDFFLKAATSKTVTNTKTGEIKILPLLQGQPGTVYYAAPQL